jgi:4'-phosphopantetheinyl transferase
VNLPHFPVERLVPHLVQVWSISLPHVRGSLEALHGLLSVEERRRAGRFVFEPDRHRFVVTHGILRILLGQYLNDEPAGLTFRYGAHGKPILNQQENDSESLCFNVSHSGDYCLCAFALSREVGVDIEVMRSNVEYLQLADRFFARREYEDLRQVPEEARQALFYRYWACKEAYLKARGLGLSSGLERIELRFDADGVIRSRDSKSDPSGQDVRWAVKELSLGQEVAAAVAARGDDWDIAISHYAPLCARG